MSTIKKCDICKRIISIYNPIRKITMFFGKDVINGVDKFYQKEIDICLECRNELTNRTARTEYEFVQDKKYEEIKKGSYVKEDVFIEVTDIEPGINPKELGYYELVEEQYVLTEDETVVEDKTYYRKEERYVDNPSELGWYEKVNIDYVLSQDVEVDLDKTYFLKKGYCNG